MRRYRMQHPWDSYNNHYYYKPEEEMVKIIWIYLSLPLNQHDHFTNYSDMIFNSRQKATGPGLFSLSLSRDMPSVAGRAGLRSL